MGYPLTSESSQSEDLDNIDMVRTILAITNRFPANDKVPSSVAVQAAAGTGATATISGGSSDFRGQVTVTAGTTPAAGAQAIITPSVMPAGWSATGSVVNVRDLSGVEATDGVKAYVTLQATTWTLNFAVAPTAGHIYVLGYVLTA